MMSEYKPRVVDESSEVDGGLGRAASVWGVSLPAGATLVAFVTFNNLGNGIVKWAVQRPRPPGHTSQRVRNVRSAGEKDLSFPSGHTQFFSGLLVCAATLAHPDGSWLGAGLFGGAIAGLSRNYLGVHFASDTLCGLLLGAALGAAWATHDPYAFLLHTSPATSVAVATALVGAPPPRVRCVSARVGRRRRVRPSERRW